MNEKKSVQSFSLHLNKLLQLPNKEKNDGPLFFAIFFQIYSKRGSHNEHFIKKINSSISHLTTK